MLIESKIKRQGGTPVQMGNTLYEFKPDGSGPDAPHVCEVTDDEHISRFLGIAEGFKLASKASAAPAPAPSHVPPAAATATEPSASAASTEPAAPAGPADAVAPAAKAAAPAEPSMVIKNGRKKIDLAAMNKKALLAFAKEEGFAVDKKADEATLRAEIHKQATAE